MQEEACKKIGEVEITQHLQNVFHKQKIINPLYICTSRKMEKPVASNNCAMKYTSKQVGGDLQVNKQEEFYVSSVFSSEHKMPFATKKREEKNVLMYMGR